VLCHLTKPERNAGSTHAFRICIAKLRNIPEPAKLFFTLLKFSNHFLLFLRINKPFAIFAQSLAMARTSKKKVDGRKKNKGTPGISGRKKISDKKVNVSIYVRESEIEALGGKDKTREIALNAINVELVTS